MATILATWIAISVPASTPSELRLSSQMPWTRLRDQWFQVDLGDKNAGWLHIEVEQADGGVDGMQYRTLEVLNITINRGADVAHTAVETEMVEDAAGQPATTRFVQSMALETIEVTSAFKTDAVHITSVRGKKQQSSTAPLATEEFFGRYEAERIFLNRCSAGETDISVTTIRPELGHQLINVSRVFVESIPMYEYLDASGAMSSAPVTVWDMQARALYNYRYYNSIPFHSMRILLTVLLRCDICVCAFPPTINFFFMGSLADLGRLVGDARVLLRTAVQPRLRPRRQRHRLPVRRAALYLD